MSTLRPIEHPRAQYLRKPEPVVFPVEAEVPESRRHLELRTALYLILKYALRNQGTVGSDQFVYWDPTNPRACLAPDAFFKLGVADVDFESWKVWERGAPDVAVEIASRSDEADEDWEEKLARYRKVGLKELVRFDRLTSEPRLRVWNRVDGDLVERKVEDESAASAVIPYFWVVVTGIDGAALRLAEDAKGERLAPTPDERAEREAKHAELETRRAEQAEAELKKVRAELAALRGK